MFDDAGDEVDIDGRFTNSTKAKAYEVSKHESLVLDAIDIDPLAEGDVVHRIEEFDGEIEFFPEKFQGVGESGTATGDVDVLRRGSTVLAAVVIGGACDFRRKAGERVADHHGERGEGFIQLLGVATAEGNQAVGGFLLFRLTIRNAVFLGDGRGDGAAADCNTSGEEKISHHVDEVAGLRADIDQQGGFLRFAVRRDEGIVDRHGRYIDLKGGEARVHDGGVDFIEGIRLDGDDDAFFFAFAFEKFVIPNHLVEGERDVLLCLESDELLDVVVLKGGQPDEADESRLARDRVADLGFRDT